MSKKYNPFGADELSDSTIETPQQGNEDKNNKNTFFIFIILGAVLLLSAGGYYAFNLENTKKKTIEGEVAVNTVKTQLKIDSVIFLNHLLNMNYTSFRDERNKAEEFMTTELKTSYENIFYETSFSDSITNGYLTTNFTYNDILPVAIQGMPGVPAIKVIGVIKYSSVKKNVFVEMPITIILAWKKDTDGIFKIDNIVME
jgi:hypothetical protein